MASKYIDRIVANTANVVGNVYVDGTLFTSNVDGSSNFGIQMNVETYEGDISNVENITIENVYGNVEIDTYEGDLNDFDGTIGTIGNMGNINGNINDGVDSITVGGNLVGNINGNITTFEGDYTVGGDVTNLSNITISGDLNIQGGAENYTVNGTVEDMDITGDPTVTADSITNYTISGNVTDVSNITIDGGFTIQGGVENYHTGEVISLDIADGATVSNITTGSITNYTIGGNVSDVSNNTVSGNFTIQGNVENYHSTGDNLTLDIASDAVVSNINGNITNYTIGGNVSDVSNNTVSGNFTIQGDINGDVGNITDAVVHGNLVIQGNVENYTITGDVTDSNVTVQGNVGDITNLYGNLENTGDVNVTNYTIDGVVDGNININDANIGNDLIIHGTVQGSIGDINDSNVTVQGSIGDITNFSGNLENTGDVNITNYTIEGDVNGDIIDANIGNDLIINGNVENYHVTGDVGDISDSTVTVQGNIGDITNFSGNLENTGDVTVDNHNFTGDLVGNIIGGVTNINLDSNVIDLGATIRLNTGVDPAIDSGITVANVDGDQSMLYVNSNEQWEFSSPSDTVVLTPHVTASNSLIVGNDDIIDINGGSVQNTSTYIYTSHSTTGTILEASITDFIADIKTVVETGSGTEFMSGTVTGNGTVLFHDSTSTDLSYAYNPGPPNIIFIDPSTETITRQTSTVTLTIL